MVNRFYNYRELLKIPSHQNFQKFPIVTFKPGTNYFFQKKIILLYLTSYKIKYKMLKR